MGSPTLFGPLVTRMLHKGVRTTTAMKRVARTLFVVSVIGAGSFPLSARAQQVQDAEVEVLQVRPNFYMIAGAGGNIAVQIGEDGIVLVDTGSASMSERVSAAIRKLAATGVTYIIDSSDDTDHVGGNAAIPHAVNPAGWPETVIVATQSAQDRLAASQRGNSASATETMYLQDEKPLYLNGEGIQVLAQRAAHTDGDAMVFFRRSDVLVAGDVLDTTRFPVIDLKRGGSIHGEIEALNRIITLAIPSIPFVFQPGGTLVIPGHGYICERDDVVRYRNMITIIRDVVQDMIKRGMSLEQVKAADPTKGYRARFGSDTGAWTTDRFVEAVYRSLRNHPEYAALAADVGK
jgi:glyoxylase-like metal-dependent hydrolase (beta-lactamase superfamily II)